MFGKSDKTRIQDTLTAVENAPYLTALIRQQISNFITSTFPRLTPADQQTYHALSGDMSVKANIAIGVAKGTGPEREKRRAIFLIWKAIGKAQNIDGFIIPRAKLAMSMPAASLDAALSDAMLKAAVIAPGTGGQFVFQELTTHPVRFLTEHRLIVLGTPEGADRFSTAPNGDYTNELDFNFQYDAGENKFVLGKVSNAQLGAFTIVPVISVPAVHWSQVPGVGAAPGIFTGVLGCELSANADFMLTTQFTGCAFSWTDHGGTIRASHISPAGGGATSYPGGGVALATALSGVGGTMHNAGGTRLTVFGAGAGNAPVAAGADSYYPNPQTTAIRWVTIIGVRKGGVAWRFYTQVVGGNSQILQHRRIM